MASRPLSRRLARAVWAVSALTRDRLWAAAPPSDLRRLPAWYDLLAAAGWGDKPVGADAGLNLFAGNEPPRKNQPGAADETPASGIGGAERPAALHQDGAARRQGQPQIRVQSAVSSLSSVHGFYDFVRVRPVPSSLCLDLVAAVTGLR